MPSVDASSVRASGGASRTPSGPTVLVANRGEIALRIFRTARRMGMRCVAVFSEADAGAPFVVAADAAACIGPPAPAESYLRAERIVEAARRLGADLVHPGFGFLSEDAAFGRTVTEAGLVFVGPPPDVLAALGDKAEAKRIAEAAGVPVLPGYRGEDQSDEALAVAADAIGFPLIVKPRSGGGGKGMAVVEGPDQLAAALASARRVAAGAFGDPRLLLERHLGAARHIEVQILADGHGNVVHLGERDCSLQRRHQKIVEESPSPAVDPPLRERLTGAAVALARHVGYRSAGTAEFLLETARSGAAEPARSGAPGPTFGFIEMNARLQVEHPVTEMTTGLDLVESQLRVALGEPLPFTQADVVPTGHAIEVRLYAEDPASGFLPQAGRLLHVRWPAGARIDAGVEEGSVVTTDYDPMLAKIIVHAGTRACALAALRSALDETEILPLRTNLAFLASLAADGDVAAGNVTTTWLASAMERLVPTAAPSDAADDGAPPDTPVALAGAVAAARVLAGCRGPDPWDGAGPWRLFGDGTVPVVLRRGGHETVVEVAGRGPFRVGGHVLEPATVSSGSGIDDHGWVVDGVRAAAVLDGDAVHVWSNGSAHEFRLGLAPRTADGAAPGATLGSPMPGVVIAVRTVPGEKVGSGQVLVIVEAMKMELEVKAPADGVVAAVLCAPGDHVSKDQPLVALADPDDTPGEADTGRD